MGNYENKLVKKHNDLLQKTINNMTYEENKIINVLLAKYKSAETDKVIDSTITANDLCDLMDIKKREPNTIKNIDTAIINLNNKANLTWRTERKTTAITYFSKIEFDHITGLITFKWNEEIKKYLDAIQQEYTLYNIDYYKLLKSKNSQILYELMKSFEKMKKCPKTYTPIEELRQIFKIKEDTYKTYHLFKVNVLDRAIKEINKKTDINISYEQNKKGRNVVGIYWFIDRKENEEQNETAKQKNIKDTAVKEERTNNKTRNKKYSHVEPMPNYQEEKNKMYVPEDIMNEYFKKEESEK